MQIKQTTIPWTALIIGVCALLAFLLPSVLLLGTYLYLNVFGMILPGVHVGDTNIGWMTTEQATYELDRIWNSERQITISDGERVWSARPSDLGLTVNAVETVETAYQIGRGSDGLSDIFQLVFSSTGRIAPIVNFNTEMGRTQLESAAQFINIPATEAALAYQDGEWQAAPGQSGLVLDVDTTVSHITDNSAMILTGGYLPISMLSVPPHIEDTTLAVDLLNQSLHPPLRFQAYDPINDESIKWDTPTELLANWVTIDSSNSLSIDEAAVSAYLLTWQDSLAPDRKLEDVSDLAGLLNTWENQQAFSLTIRHNPTTYTVGAGENLEAIGRKLGMPYWMILDANPQISYDNLPAGEELIIPSKNDLLPLPIIPQKRIVISIAQQRLHTYENGELLNTYIASTGIDSSPTHPGVFQVRTHEIEAYASVWDLTMPHFLGIYEGWPGFMNGIHGLPTLSSGRVLWADVLGRKASYGCIILNLQAAEDLYNWAENGVVVEVTY